MRPVTLNEYLSTASSWPRRLLGWEPYTVERTEAEVDREYDRDRYAPLLDLTSTDPEAYKVAEFASMGMELDAPMFISVGEEIFSTTLRQARHLWAALIRSLVDRFATGVVCELGCGYGFNLANLGRPGYGGEYSANAVAIGRRLGLDVAPFNYYQAETYDLIRPGSTILTVHSIEQIPSAQGIVDQLRLHRRSISEVIHVEPGWLDDRTTWLGLTRNRYNELIDHNHDLVSILRSADDIEIVQLEADAFGMHPLNSSNLIVWRFRGS